MAYTVVVTGQAVTVGAVDDRDEFTLEIPSIGAQGPQGQQGAQGQSGPQGTSGAQGPQGSQGSTGNTGAPGASGAQGPQGAQGDAGPQGPQGIAGAQGSAGVTGSQGAQGDTGSQGPQGVAGITGSQGAQGDAGVAGSQGPQGSAGAAGSQGPQGAQGAAGSTGAQGAQGITGTTGSQGAQGAQGSNGTQGAQGAQGSAGVQGPQGSQGVAGGVTLSPGDYVVRASKQDGTQTISNGTDTVVTFADDFDPQGWFSSNKFQPTVAGYYSISTSVWWEAGTDSTQQNNIQLRKNGTTQLAISQFPVNLNTGRAMTISTIVYFNGSTDYIEVTAYTGNPTSQNIASSGSGTYLTASLYAYGQGPQGSVGAQGPQGLQGSQGVVNTSASFSWTNTHTFSANLVVNSVLTLDQIQERVVPYSSANGSFTLDCANSHIFNLTSPAAAFTPVLSNFTCDNNFATSVTLIITQGGTPYVPTSNVTIGSTNTSVTWQGGTPPTGNANKRDIVTYSILNNSNTFTILGQLTSFG